MVSVLEDPVPLRGGDYHVDTSMWGAQIQMGYDFPSAEEGSHLTSPQMDVGNDIISDGL